MKKFETKDSGKRQQFKTGMQRDSGDKALYREIYYPLDKMIHSKDVMLRQWKDDLLVSVKEVANGDMPRDYLVEVISLVHKIEAVNNNEKLISSRCLSLDKRYGELMMRGAQKYNRGNWKKAETMEELERFKDSLDRHTEQYLSGEYDEDHATAILFNAFGVAMVMDKLGL